MYHETKIIGNVGKDAEMRFTPSGQAVTNFNVAVNEQFKNAAGEQIKRTVWFRVSTFGKQAEIMNQYVRKGMLVFVSGRLTADPVTGGPKVFTKQDGSASASFELAAHEVKFLSKPENGNGQHAATPFDAPIAEDDIPF